MIPNQWYPIYESSRLKAGRPFGMRRLGHDLVLWRGIDGRAARIDREELIPAGAIEEIEIRANALHAIELIAAESQKMGRTASAISVDFFLWNRGQTPEYKNAKPRHRTRTVFY